MATKKAPKKAAKKAATETEKAPKTEPKFPYTTKVASLRRLLKAIPKNPLPDKFDKNLLASWGFRDTNDLTMIRVLKAVGLLNEANQPTTRYAEFMNTDGGGKALGTEVRRVYAPLFQASHTPHTESAEKLKNLFNIHSGGGTATMENQIGTFKALAENADVSLSKDGGHHPHSGGVARPEGQQNGGSNDGGQGPGVHINLHIHLPENKSRREYTDIIEDIGRYIFGRTERGSE